MRITTLALTAATAGLTIAQPHKHHKHADAHKRQVTQTEYAAEATAIAFVLNGQTISEEEACNGIESHLYEWADGSDSVGVCSSAASSSSSSSTTSAAPSSTSTWSSSSSAESSPSSAAAFYQASSSSAAPAAPSPAAASSWSSGATGVDADFPDGQIDCGSFPSQYGAVSLDYLGLGGWAGIQAVTIVGNAVSNIVTGISGTGCSSGSMCSYACPPGYQKSQWPSTQGSTGQSVGGLSCNNGKLFLTNSGLSSKLCIPGTGNVQATNNAGGVVSICRTDYPGTESETIPVALQPGSTEQLAVPDAASYYTWEGKSTSAQYYLNPPGYGPEQACTWGSAGQPLGNFAPINFGVGAKDGTTWLSIFQNAPTTNAQYPGTVELTGNLSGTCKYSNGQYCGVTGCNTNGCTVSIISGTATYVVSA